MTAEMIVTEVISAGTIVTEVILAGTKTTGTTRMTDTTGKIGEDILEVTKQDVSTMMTDKDVIGIGMDHTDQGMRETITIPTNGL